MGARAQLTLELPAGFALDAGGTRVRVSGAAALGTDLALGELPLLVEGSLDLAAGVQLTTTGAIELANNAHASISAGATLSAGAGFVVAASNSASIELASEATLVGGTDLSTVSRVASGATLTVNATSTSTFGHVRGALAAADGGVLALHGRIAVTAQGNGATRLGGAGLLQLGCELQLNEQLNVTIGEPTTQIELLQGSLSQG